MNGRNRCLFCLVIALLLLALLAVGVPAFAQTNDQISPEVRQQIADIEQQKLTFDAAEQKMDSELVFLSRMARGKPVSTNIARLVNTSLIDKAGRVNVDIRGDVADVLTRVKGAAVVQNHSAGHRHVRAAVAAGLLYKLAQSPSVKSIRQADLATTNVGALTSQGYISHTANTVIAKGITGAGMKIGVISDSATPARVAALIASGDLGPDTVVLEASTGTDEGAAMMEIVHDLAPGAQLFFATGNGGQAHMAANIAALAAVGCQIIVDDLTYFAEGAFQDGPIAQAVNNFVAAGGLYFSSAANSGNLDSGTAGTWEGDFSNGGPVGGPIASLGETGLFHLFGAQLFDVLTVPASLNTNGQIISLKWSDPLGGSTNDYDLFILNAAGTAIKKFSAAAQTGTQDPIEILQYTAAVNDRVVVVLFSGQPRALRVDTSRGRLQIATAGSTFGHNAGASTLSMAATYWNSAKTGTRPFVGAANPIEVFSSDGPRKMFYNPNGTAITPGNVLFASGGGITLQKPDFTAADGVSCKTTGFLPFFGTSAAAPHAAAVAALVWSAKPSLTNTQVRQILLDTALNNMAPGWDRDGGYGIVMAAPAVTKAQSTP